MHSPPKPPKQLDAGNATPDDWRNAPEEEMPPLSVYGEDADAPPRAYLPDARDTVLAKLDWTKGSSGKPARPRKTLSNLRWVLDDDDRFNRWHADSFRILTIDHNNLPMTDNDLGDEIINMERRYGFTYGIDIMHRQISCSANKRGVDSLRDWFDELPEWDRTSRIEGFLVKACGCRDTKLYRAYSRRMFVAGVARAMLNTQTQSGHRDKHGRMLDKVDTMPILIGAQGAFKSQLLRALVPDVRMFKSSPIELKTAQDRKETVKGLQGKWIIEVQEADAMLASHPAKVKAFLSEAVDNYRSSYGRIAEDHPRRCIFIGTANTPDLLRDLTGNRRMWPIVVGQCSVAYVEENREQLWAEALYRFKEGRAWWLSAAEEALHNDHVNDFAEPDSMLDAMRDAMESDNAIALGMASGGVTTAEILTACRDATGGPKRARDIGSRMRELGYEQQRTSNRRRWVLLPT